MFKKYVRRKNERSGNAQIFPIWGAVSKDTAENLRHRLIEKKVVWEVSKDTSLPHFDHLEMTGFKASMIVSYGVNEKREMRLFRHLVFPLLRKIPNDTGGSFAFNFNEKVAAEIYVNGKEVKKEYTDQILIKGSLEIHNHTNLGIEIIHKLFPSVHHQAGIEKITVQNTSLKNLEIDIDSPDLHYKSPKKKGLYGSYEMFANLAGTDGAFAPYEDYSYQFFLKPGESHSVYLVFASRKQGEILEFNAAEEEQERENFIKEVTGSLVLETPDEILNTLFEFVKIRNSESVIKTKGGLMHAPGGGSFYAALWTNDQCEYTGPLTPFIGYEPAVQAAVNAYKQFMRFMDPEFKQPLVSSIIAEGDDYWNGAGDRGDAAMFAYGASRFCLALGDRKTAKEIWPGIEWSLNYSLLKKNKAGVIESDSDELENRFESGSANLFTSSLVYDALNSAILLGKVLKKPKSILERFVLEAEHLKQAIENYFGSEVEGYKTYRYYEGNHVLRAWICIPLAMGIYDRAEETVKALLSPRLWSANGLNTEAGKVTFWDRSTLYALRGIFASGKPDTALEYLRSYSEERLLKEHVPYPVEAYPEGNQKQLAAESALYARIFTEGLFGIRPTGFKSFEMTIQMPANWDKMALRNIKAFGENFDIEVERKTGKYRLTIRKEGQAVYEGISDLEFTVDFLKLETK